MSEALEEYIFCTGNIHFPKFGEGIHVLHLPNHYLFNKRWKWEVKFEVTRERWELDPYYPDDLQPPPYKYVARVFCTMTDESVHSDTICWGVQVSAKGGIPPMEEIKRHLKPEMRATYYFYELFEIEYFPGMYGDIELDFEITVKPVELPALNPSPSVSGTSALVQSLGDLLASRMMFDVVLRTKEGNETAHRNILAARSEFFKVKFKPEWREGDTIVWDGDTSIVDMSDVTLPVLQAMLKYIYTGSYGDDVDMIELLLAADKYLITDLCNEIRVKVEKNLESGNPIAPVCDLLKTSTIHNSPSLRTAVLKYMKKHPHVFKSTEWNEFHVDNHELAAKAMLEMVNLP